MSSFLRAGARTGSKRGAYSGASVGSGADRISLGLSSVSGIGLEDGGWPVPFGAGGRPSSALAGMPQAERRASAMTDARMTATGITWRSQPTAAPGSHGTRGRYRSTYLCPAAGHLTGLRARGKLVGIVERIEPRAFVPLLERPSEQSIREPRVLREARSVQIAPNHFPLHRAFGLVLAVVAVPSDDRSERLRARAEVRPPGVVLEPDERPVRRIHEQIADETFPASAGGDVEEAKSPARGADRRHARVD